mgnify:CR=1 FL=1|jgi:hypothetical protein
MNTLPAELSTTSSMGSLSSPNEGFFATNTTWKIVGVVVLIALLGFNILLYLGNAVEEVGGVVKPLLQRIVSVFGFTITETSKQVVDISAEGTKASVDIAAGTIKSAIDVVEDIGEGTGVNFDPDEVPPVQNKKNSSSNTRESSSVQGASMSRPKKQGAQNFCYVGTDRGNRTCIPASNAGECESGDIFPSHDVCVNPNLRHHTATTPERIVSTEVHPAPPSYP